MDKTRRLQYRWAAGRLLVQGVLMEGLVFALPYLQDNLYLMMGMSGVFAAMRILGAIGLLRNRLWGLGLSLINCLVTLVLMIFLLPAGLLDGVLSGTALVLLLFAWLGRSSDGQPKLLV